MRFSWHWQHMHFVQKAIKIPGGADVPFIMLRILFCSSWCCCCCCCCSSCCFCWYCCCWSVGTATAGFTIKHTVIIVIIITDCFYIVLFSALKQTHCAHVTCDPERLTVPIHSTPCTPYNHALEGHPQVACVFSCNLPPSKRCIHSTVWLLHGWCHMKILPSRHTFCDHTTMHQFTVSHHSKGLCRVYVCLAVTCHLHLWQNDWDLLRATAVARGRNRYQKRSQHRQLTLENKILMPLQWWHIPPTFQSQVQHSNHWVSPLLIMNCYYWSIIHSHNHGLLVPVSLVTYIVININ